MKNVLSSFNWIFTSGRRFQLLSKNLVIEIRVLTVISQKKTSWLILLWQESPGSFVNSSLEVVLFTEKANQNFCLEKLSIVLCSPKECPLRVLRQRRTCFCILFSIFLGISQDGASFWELTCGSRAEVFRRLGYGLPECAFLLWWDWCG